MSYALRQTDSELLIIFGMSVMFGRAGVEVNLTLTFC